MAGKILDVSLRELRKRQPIASPIFEIARVLMRVDHVPASGVGA